MFDYQFHTKIKGTALYNITSKKRLSEILLTTPEKIKNLSQDENLYSCWTKEKKNGGVREIEAPCENLKSIQKRIAGLLQRIEPPNYFMAPVKGRSYVDNAALHVRSNAFRLLDIEDFFPSCTKKRVFWFFHKCIGCSRDISAIVANLTTHKERLPQGSPASPILAYFPYVDMWEKISNIVEAANLKLSVYADGI